MLGEADRSTIQRTDELLALHFKTVAMPVTLALSQIVFAGVAHWVGQLRPSPRLIGMQRGERSQINRSIRSGAS
jgi:uncharacterized protein YwlG (UPF0340 family)